MAGQRVAATPDAPAEPPSATIRRSLHGLTKSLASANAFGALVSFAFIAWVLPPPKGTPTSALTTNAPVFAGYLIATIYIGHRWGRSLTLRRLDWLNHDRPPTVTEQRLTLRLPLGQVVVSGSFWLAAAVLFLAVNLHYSGEFAFRIATTALLAGLATCALSYLLAERVLRAATVRALAASTPLRPVGPGVSARTLLAWALATAVPVLGIVLVAVGILHGDTPGNHATAWSIVFLSALALVFGATAMVLSARAIAEPIAAVRAALARVEAGEHDAEVTVYDATEVGLLQAGFNRMARGLAERERLRDLFGRHVGEAVARRALDGGLELGGELREAGVVFVDVVGSTTIALETPPHELVEQLNQFFALVQEVTERSGGWINKFEGDAALAVFGVPLAIDDPAGSALCCARELSDRLTMAGALPAATGVSAGSVVAGNVGAPDRFEYTVIGDPVNEAARLTELAKRWHAPVLASGAALARARAEEARRWRREDEIVLRGRGDPTCIAVPAGAAVAAPGHAAQREVEH